MVARPGHSPGCGSSEGVRRGRRLGRRDAGLRPRMPPDQGGINNGNADSPPIPTANLLRYLKRSRASLQQSKDCSTGRPRVTLRHRHTNQKTTGWTEPVSCRGVGRAGRWGTNEKLLWLLSKINGLTTSSPTQGPGGRRCQFHPGGSAAPAGGELTIERARAVARMIVGPWPGLQDEPDK